MKRFTNFIPGPIRSIAKHTASGGLFEPHARLSFSQEGEDLVVERLVGDQDVGFFVDVGAHHPTRFSNTYMLYKRGWRGINIDPTPGVMATFRKKRPRDINLELAIAEAPGTTTLFLFDEPALNSTSRQLSSERDEHTDYRIIDEVEIQAATLADVLREYVPRDVTEIDLMSIDTEGTDLQVLRSNDWTRFRPRILLFEALKMSLLELIESDEIRYLGGQGYELNAFLANTVVMIESTKDSA